MRPIISLIRHNIRCWLMLSITVPPRRPANAMALCKFLHRLDYGSATLAGLPKQLMDRLQPVQNAAARLIFKACRRDHIQPLLRRLHWLRMPERISFQLVVLVYRYLQGSAPGYLPSDLQRVSYLNARRRLCSSTTSAPVSYTHLTLPTKRIV